MPLVSWLGYQSHPSQLTPILTLWSLVMKRILQLGIVVLIVALARAQAMGAGGGISIFFAIPKVALDTKADTTGDRVNRIERAERVNPAVKGADFVLSKLDPDMIKEFSKAWQLSGNGTTDSESVVLILRMMDNRYMAKTLGSTNEHRSFTFRWHPGAVAIIHTHPNNASPKPQDADRMIADKYGVPIFTLALSGMFVYDPYTKKTTKVQQGLDWLDSSIWFRQ
jgi:hypothetical protein